MIQPKVISLECPKLVDLALLDIQTHLTKKLPWLDYAFGKSEKQINEKGRAFPAIYQGDNEYLNLMPDTHIGNYSFFEIDDGQDVEQLTISNSIKDLRYSTDFGIVFFFDFRDIYDTPDFQTIENVKHDILSALMSVNTGNCWVSLDKIYSEAQNVYEGYDRISGSFGEYISGELDRQFMKRPFGALKITGTLKYWEGC